MTSNPGPFAVPDFSGVTPSEDDIEDDDVEDVIEDDVAEDEAEDEFVDSEDEAEEVAPAAPVDGGTAEAVLDHIARSIVDDTEAVRVDVSSGRGGVRLDLHVAPSDMGRIIGRRGRAAQALRSVVRAAAAKDGTDAVVDIVD